MRSLLLIITLSVCTLCSTAIANEEAPAESGGGPSVFDGTIADALWTVVAFCALAIVLGKFAWKPLLKGLKEREDHISTQIAQAESKRREAERILEEYKLQAQAILEQVAEEAVKLERETLDRARIEAAQIKDKAQSNIEFARAAAARQLWEQAGEMLLAVGSEVLGRTMTAQDNQRLIDEAVAKLKEAQCGSGR